MNKTDLVTRVSIDAGLSRREATDAIDAALRAIRSAVALGERVTLPGFGTFERRERAARLGRNPRTGEDVPIPATLVPAFRPGTDFKAAVADSALRRTAASRRGASRRSRRPS